MLRISKTFIGVGVGVGALAEASRLQQAIITDQEGVPLPAGKLHVTVCSFGSLKPHRDILKSWVGREDELPAPPRASIELSAQLQQLESGRWSWACRLQDQPLWHSWRMRLLGAMGIPVIDEGRVFHLSLVNKDGSPFSSVGPAFEPGTELGETVSL